MRIKIIVMIFIIISNLVCNYEHTEYIAVNDGKQVHLLNIRGIIQRTISLPVKIEYDFYLNNKYIYFYGEDKKLHAFNWRKNKEMNIPSGPFYFKFKAKNYGPEVYHEITASDNNNYIGILITPEYFDSFGDPNEFKDYYYYNEMLEDSRVGIINIKKKFFSLLPLQNGEYHNLILQDKSLIGSNGGLFIYNIKNNNIYYIYTITASTEKPKNALILGKYSNEIIYAFTDYKQEEEKIYKINRWDIKNKIEKTIYNFDETNTGKEIFNISDPRSRISKDKQKLAWVENDNVIVIYNLITNKKEIIYNANNNKIVRIQFYYE